VLYIVAVAHSGTTILANALGGVEGFFSGGELRYVWRRGALQNQRCGCGVSFHECPLWRQVRQAGGAFDPAAAETLARIEEQRLRMRRLPLLLHSPKAVPGDLRHFRERVDGLYRAIQEATGCGIIVDSSKTPVYGHLLETLPNVELFLVHLVRDSRATSFSLLRKRPHSRARLAQAATVWTAYHGAAEILGRRAGDRYLRLRYEDFAARPRETVERILGLLGEQGRELPFLDKRTVELSVNHTVSGNPIRFDTGSVAIDADDEWRGRMTMGDRRLVTTLTWPLLLRYGYRLSSSELRGDHLEKRPIQPT
jgi:hypothetical protein